MILNPRKHFYILHASSLRRKRKGLPWFNGPSHSTTIVYSHLDLRESIWSFGPLPHLCSSWHSAPHGNKTNHPHPPVKYLHMAYLLLRKGSLFWNGKPNLQMPLSGFLHILRIYTVPVKRTWKENTVLEKVCSSKISYSRVKNILHI